MELTETTIREKLLNMRNQFLTELKNTKNPDYVTTMILKTKIITIGQVMDELKITNPDDLLSDNALESIIQSLDN